MNDDVAELVEELGEPSGSTPVPAERLRQYADIVPPVLLQYWQALGFAGFDRGRLWLCDPREWTAAVAAWTANLDLELGTDTWHAITRSAFGELQLWGERTGLSLSIEPVHGLIFPSAGFATRMDTEQRRNNQIRTALMAGIDDADLNGSDGKKLFDRAVRAHGEVGPHTMYTFVPAYQLGGPLTVDHIEIADAATHVELLASLGPHRVMGDITGG